MAEARGIRATGASIVEAIARVLEGVLVHLGDALADVVETAGSLVRDGLVHGGDVVRLRAVGAWLGGIAAGSLNVVGGAIKGAFGIGGGVPAGAARLVGGIVLWDRRLAGRGAVGIGSSIGGVAILVGGAVLAALQRVVVAERAARPLTTEEQADLRTVFGRSLATYNVRVVEGRSGAFGANDRPFTLGNTIYLKGVDPLARRDVLVHEAVHVWQYQHEGPRYTADALGAQVRYGWRGRGAYDWRAALARGQRRWVELNKEAQGRLVQDLWSECGRGCFTDPRTAQLTTTRDGTTVDHTPIAKDAVATLQGRRTRRISSRLGRVP